MPSAPTIPLLAMTSHASYARYVFMCTRLGCSSLARKAGPVLYTAVSHLHVIKSKRPYIHVLKHLINQFKPFCCLLKVGPQSKCGNCYCKRPSKTVMLCLYMTDSWKMSVTDFSSLYKALNKQTHSTILPQSLHPSVSP